MKKVTLGHIVEGVLKNTQRDYRVLSSNDKQVRFKIKCENVNLFGTVTPDSYVMNIKKANGELIDEVTCSISHSDDIFKRINESLTTGEKLSKYVTAVSDAKKTYLTPGYVTESEDSDDEEDKQILLDDEIEDEEDLGEPVSLQDSLEDLIDTTLIMADDTSNLIELVDGTENDTENKAELVAVMGSMYSLADDIQTLIDEIYPEPDEEDMDESISRKRIKRDIRTEAINKLSEVSILLRKEKNCKEIREAIKVIKSSLLLK